jgi:deazaflavin-dependent oxidoreductase (nitroreductase family)
MAAPPIAFRSFNRVALLVAGRRFVPVWAVLRHRGRRSGREYEIPVAVLATPDAFVIGLPWGRGTDWVRNVWSADGCVVRWRGQEVDCVDPEFVAKEVALAAATPVLRPVLKRLDFEGGFLQLRRADSRAA